MNKDDVIDNQNTEEAQAGEAITQVGEETIKKPFPLWWVVVGVFFLGFLFVLSGEDSEGKDDLAGVGFTKEEYKVENSQVPTMPQKAAVEKPNLTPLPDEVAVLTLEPELTQEQKQQAKAAQDLADRRQRAPLVLLNKKDDSSDEGQPNIRQEASRRMAELQRSTQDALSTLTSDKSEDDKGIASLTTPDIETVEAGFIEDRAYKVLQGKVIPGVLETAINSDLPGLIRAIVSDSVYSEDGNSLLIPKGSRLIGEYNSETTRGQSRVFVIWSRLIRPDGVHIKMDSPGTDSLGRAGLTGFVDTHFMERFGASALLSLIGGYAQAESNNDNQMQAVGESFNKSSEIALEDSINIKPTIHINQGAVINILVAKDLNFKQAVLFAQHANKR